MLLVARIAREGEAAVRTRLVLKLAPGCERAPWSVAPASLALAQAPPPVSPIPVNRVSMVSR